MPSPNVLWICTDQQRYDTLGCYGNLWVHTPHIDALAQRGIRFAHAYCQSPVCTPSRASFLTGRYPRTTRCRQNGQAIPPDEVLVTKLFANAGYYCGLAGKLHIAPCHPRVCPELEARIDDGYHEFHWSHHPNPDWPTNAYTQWLSQRGVAYKRPRHPRSTHVQLGMPAEHHHTTWCAERTIDFIEARKNEDQPWLFSLNFFDPHHPFDPPPELLARYEAKLDDIPLPDALNDDLQSKPVFQRIDHDGAYARPDLYPASKMTDTDHCLVRAAYWTMCDLIDLQVGRVLDALQSTGQADNTLIIFMSDHGELLGDHGVYLKGPFFYEPSIRVPLIFSQPGRIPESRRSSAMVELIDLAPTLLDAAGLPPHVGMQGRSLWPLITSQTSGDHHRDDVYCEYYNATQSHKNPTAHATMVSDGRHKLVAFHGLPSEAEPDGELYDLQQDPDEQTNLWRNPAYAEVKMRMLLRLTARMAWTVDPLPPRLAPW